MIALILAHPAFVAFISYLIISAVIGSMPKLPPDASYKARWAYGTAQALSLNLRFALNFFKVPGVPSDPSDEKEEK